MDDAGLAEERPAAARAPGAPWWAAVALTWLVTRWAVLAHALAEAEPWNRTETGDIRFYAAWLPVLRQGRFPADDQAWQYPPGAALPMLLPDLLAGGDMTRYFYGFVSLVVLADLVTLLLLLRAAARGGSALGAWFWTLGIPLLGLICYARIDVPVTALAVAALVATGPILSGVLIGAGTLVKGWPILLLVGYRRWRGTLAAGLAALAVTGFGALAAWRYFPGALSFLEQQRERGLEVEAVAATPLLLSRPLGSPLTVQYRYGSWELLGPYVDTALLVCRLGLVAGGLFLLVCWWRARWRPPVLADFTLTAVLISMVTSRVLSPQYLIWAVGLAAACLTRRDTSQRPVAAPLLVCCVLTQLEFPILWNGIFDRGLAVAVVIAVRNALLVGATLWSAALVWRSTRGGRDRAAEPRPAVVEPAPV